jgi:1-acyl-sn-glycerol-3-phosphate acyltransferase
MLRTFGAGVRTFVLTPLFFLYTMYESAKLNRLARRGAGTDEIEAIAQTWSQRFLDVPPIELTVEGAENAEPGKRYIVVSNHLSNFDIPVTVRAMPMPTRFLSKNEVSRIPLFGLAVQNAGVVMIDREATRSRHEALNEAVAKSIHKGYSILLFAEGTRSRTGEMGDFHRGAARIALTTGLDILPIVIFGTYDVNPPGSPVIYPGEVTVRILPPISLDGLAKSETKAITDDVRELISKNFEEMSAAQHQS